MLRPAQRVNNPRAIRSSFVAPQDKILEFARGWSLPHQDLEHLCTTQFIPTNDMMTVKLQFYRTFNKESITTTSNEHSNNSNNESNNNNNNNNNDSNSNNSNSNNDSNSNNNSNGNGSNNKKVITSAIDQHEGVHVVTEDLSLHDKKTDLEWFEYLVQKHTIPKEYHFELLNRIRTANNISDSVTRKQLIIIQLIALSIMSHTASETTAQNKVFVYEPHLVAHLADLIHPTKSVDFEIQTYALYALDAISRHRNKLTEVLQAFNASANHGTLLYVLRQVNNQSSTIAYPNEFLEALFTILACLLQTQPGGQMLMSAGIISTLLNILDNQPNIQIKHVTKVVGLLDTIVCSVNTSFSAFCNANGLDILIARIKSEVNQAIDNVTSQESMQDDETKINEQDLSTGALAPYDRVSLVKTMLKFLIRMMESTGTADGLRNLIDSSAPASLIQIIKHPKVFGNSVFALATNVTSTFIHNEPTSLSILQEQKLPQAFLETISKYENPNGEVLVAAVHCFGALCLNGPGLQMFNEYKPLPHFFELMTCHELLRNPAEIDGATALGNTVDELIRHHPSLKPDVFKCVTQMIKKVLELGQQDIGKPSDNSHLLKLVKTTTEDVDMTSSTEPKANEEKVECLLVSFIDLVSRFLEGLFQNQSNIREFVKDRCPEMLLDYYTLPMLPADFSVSIAADSLSYLFRMIAETSPMPTVAAIVEKVKSSIKFILEDDSSRTKSMIREFIDIKDNETEKIEKGNKMLRKFIIMYGYVGLLANICCSAILTHGKNGVALVNEFISQTGDDNIILLLGQLHRTTVWENILLRESVPKSWYTFKTTKKTGGVRNENPLGISGFDSNRNGDEDNSNTPGTTSATNTNSNNNNATSSSNGTETNDDKEPDPKDPRLINTKYFKMFLGEISQGITPIFQGLNKVSVSRRSIESGHINQSFKLVEFITKVLKDNVTWSCVNSEDAPLCKYDYLASMFSMTSILLLDDRATPSLHTPLAVKYDQNGGTQLLIDTLDKLWKSAEVIEAIPVNERTVEQQDDTLPRIDASIELLLTVLLNISSSKLLASAPCTFHFSKNKDRSAPDYFEPRDWNISVSLKIAAIRKHMESPQFKKFPKYVLRMYMKCLAQLISNDVDKLKDYSPGSSYNTSGNNGSGPSGLPLGLGAAAGGSGHPGGFPTTIPSPFNIVRTPVVPNEAGVQTLVDMGFNRAGAEQAMIRCNNQISRAVDYLFSHPTAMLGNTGGNSSRSNNNNNNNNNTNGNNISSNDNQQQSSSSTTDNNDNNDATATNENSNNNENTESSQTQVTSTDNINENDDHDESDDHDDSDDHGESDEDEHSHHDEDEDERMDEDDFDFSDEEQLEYDQSDNDEDEDDHMHSSSFPLEMFSSPRPESSRLPLGSNKGKNKLTDEESANIKSLKELRNSLREQIPEIILDLLNEREDMIFDVHDLLVVICKEDKDYKEAKRIMSMLVDRIQSSLNESDIQYTKVCSQLRLMALLLKDAQFHTTLPDIASRLSCLFNMLDNNKEDLSNPDTSAPTWLASTLLVLEIFISQSDEPIEVKLTAGKVDHSHLSHPKLLHHDSDKDTDSDEDMNQANNESEDVEMKDKQESQDENNDTKVDKDKLVSTTAAESKEKEKSSESSESTKDSVISDHQRQQLLLCCITLLKKKQLSRNDLYAVLRIIVRLTKHHDAALQLVENDGLNLLFSKPRSSLDGFQGQQAFIILILRHIIEDKYVLEEQMEDIISTWGTVPRPRNLDMNTYFRNNAAIALRDPVAFLKVSEKLCRLSRYAEYDGSRQIRVLGKDDLNNQSTTSSLQDNKLQKSTTTKQPSYVVHYILNELLTVQANRKEKTDLKYAYTGFLLQCLVELVSSYPSCKYDIYHFSRRNIKDGNNSRPRHAVLNLLINDLLHYNAIKPSDDDARKAQGLSMWTSSVLVAMCYSTLTKDEINPYHSHSTVNNNSNNTSTTSTSTSTTNINASSSSTATTNNNNQQHHHHHHHYNSKHDLTQVRKYVLDGVVHSFKSLIHSSDSSSIKYNKYLSLADLCHRILNARPNPGGNIHQQSKEDTSMQLAKIMLDKGFVGVITSAISDVDVNYPHAKTVLSAMLRPLEQLTKLAIAIERKAAEQRANESNKIEIGDDHKEKPTSSTQRNIQQAEGIEEEHENEEAPDLYRNSSLAMLDGSVMEEDEDEFGSSENEEVESFDEDEFDEDTGSDLSDMSEEDEEDEDDIESISHRHHYGSDMDEDEDENESDSSDNHDHSSDDSDDSDDEEDGREMTWRIEDIDDDGGVLVGAEITIESEDEQHNMQHGRFDENQDVDLDTLDQSDFEDEEGSEAYIEDEQDAELNDGVLIDEDDLGDSFLMDDNQQGLQFNFNDDEGWQDRSRNYGGLGFRRPGRSSQVRRLLDGGGVEVLAGSGSRDRIPTIEFGNRFSSGYPFRNLGGAAGAAGAEDITTHPLLSNNQAANVNNNATSGQRHLDNHNRRQRALVLSNLQAFEDIIGGSAIRVLESILNQASQSGQNPESFRVDLPSGQSRFMRAFEMDRSSGGGAGAGLGGVGVPLSQPLLSLERNGNTSSNNNNNNESSSSSTTIDQSRQTLTILHEFQPMSTSERWNQEGRMMYGNIIGDQAVKLSNALLNTLIPIALEEDKKRRAEEKRLAEERRMKEQEERKKAEEEKRKREEEEEEAKRKKAEEERLEAERQRQQQEQEQAAAAAAVTANTTSSSTENDESNTNQQQASSSSSGTNAEENNREERTTITINGESVDISGTGIDVEFLEALPDDLREEVVNQHMRERRQSIQPPEDDSISPEFLDALPPEIREEVLQQEAIERDRRVRQQRNASAAATATNANNNNNNANNTNDNNTTATPNQPNPTATVTAGDASESFFALDNFLNSREPFPDVSRFIQNAANRNNQHHHHHHHNKKPIGRTETIQLVDRSQLATLARLLFVPQSISKNLLNRLLLNLCENGKTRGDLLSLLICILHDGSVDLAAVDKSFAQLSLYPKVNNISSTSVSNTNTTTSSTSSSHKQQQQQNRNTTTSSSSSSVTATTAPTTVIGDSVPNLITQRCLEVLHYVVSCNEQSLTYFLTENDCLAGLKRSTTRKGKSKDANTNKPSSKYPLLVLMSLLDRPVFIENTSLMEQLMNLLTTMCRPFPALVKKYVEKVEHHQKQQQQQTTDTTKETSSSTTTTAKNSEQPTSINKDDQQQSQTQSQQQKPIPKPPTIPDHYLKMVVHVLTSGECSSRTFQFTLGVISHLSSLDGALQTITNELTDAAKHSGKQIIEDLQDLLKVLEDAMTGTDIQSTALQQFSAATSHQAKLLRVLKTIDYLYSRKRPTTTTDTENTKDESNDQLNNEKKMLAIYDKLNFAPLWRMLGSCLSVIHEKEELINVATVLLPLIESFMVVSKYAESMTNHQQQNHSPEALSNMETPDDIFFKFTEEHKKILNIMVRNNPSLMSGSFSLLVRNPKMLEFDNKRNYFVQQLHKRKEPRSHYPPLQLNVRRQFVFEDSYHQLQGRSGEEIKYGKLMVRFYDEEGVDAGGVSREWFSVLARQMFDPNYALFIASAADKLTYQPNRASWVNPDHLSFFKFVGRVIGKAIYDGRLLDAYFTRSFYKHILNRSVDYRDVEAIDPEYYKSLVWMLDNDITDVIDLTFSMEMDDFGTTKTIDLKPGGRDLPVTEQNKREYVNLVTEQKLSSAIKDQINAFLQGFHDVIPATLIQIFNEQELELLISGLPDIDIDDWKNNTTYETYHANSPPVQWFWRAVRSFDQEERAKLLQFATGTSKVPLEGFAHLQGSGGVQKFQIHKDFGGDSRLPSAHTCFNQIDLPEYDCYESLRANLFKAINECSTGFGFV
ncbi:unnamed protein product [Cunninghamella blakesleeana]